MKRRPPFQIMCTVIFALVLREMRTRFGKHRLGAFWVLFEPLAHVVIMLIIFGFRNQSTPGGMEFPVFLITGIVPFLIFQNIALRIMDGIEANMGLFAYRQIKPIDTFLARVLVEVTLFFSVYILTLAGMAWYGFDVIIHSPLQWLCIVALIIVFGFSLGIVFCVIGHSLPQIKIVIRILFFPIYLLSGVIFPIWILPKEVLDWLLWNPVVHFLELIRDAHVNHYPVVYGVSYGYVGAVTLSGLFIGLWLYRSRRLELVAQ